MNGSTGTTRSTWLPFSRSPICANPVSTYVTWLRGTPLFSSHFMATTWFTPFSPGTPMRLPFIAAALLMFEPSRAISAIVGLDFAW